MTNKQLTKRIEEIKRKYKGYALTIEDNMALFLEIEQLFSLFKEEMLEIIGADRKGKPFYWKEEHDEKIKLLAQNELRQQLRKRVEEKK